ADNAAADLICIDTDSRSCPSEEARRRVGQAAKTLLASGAKWIYKKVDSVLRGHVVAEIESLMSELGLKRTFLLPANPTLGRVIRDGKYFIRQKPLHETEFRLDPQYPRRESSVRSLLGHSDSLTIHVCALHDPLPSTGIIIGEAETVDALQQW